MTECYLTIDQQNFTKDKANTLNFNILTQQCLHVRICNTFYFRLLSSHLYVEITGLSKE